jgi:hypothetical protein
MIAKRLSPLRLKSSSVLIRPAQATAVVFLIILAIRSAVRFEFRWDTVWYHLPFAALRGGLDLPYHMNEAMQLRFQGFPPLPHLIQGVLWRITGSIHATGIVNYLAFISFLAYCHTVLRANGWLVALISLTAPLVIIHATSSYVDLFGNSFLAIGLASCFYLVLYPGRASRTILIGALTGATAAAWSKFQLVPLAMLVFFFLLCFSLPRSHVFPELTRRQVTLLILVGSVIALIPYLKNIVIYGNPFWPVRLPVIGNNIPYAERIDVAILNERPSALRDRSQFSLFFRSLFEINHPVRYPHRPRWIIDQGNASIAFRSGGFWVVGSVVYLTCLLMMLVAKLGKRALGGVLLVLGLILLIAKLPQSHELRYYLCLPLFWAASIGVLYGDLKGRFPALVDPFLGLVLVLFGYMVSENRMHYTIERVGYQEAADWWGASPWWGRLERGEEYCAVNLAPKTILMTGPTMREFTITDRTHSFLCPYPSTVLSSNGSILPLNQNLLLTESLTLHQEGKFEDSLKASLRAIELKPDFALAHNNACSALNNLRRWNDAIAACLIALKIAPDLSIARNNLEYAQRMAAETRAGGRAGP